jgi:hypothetical protein
VRVICPFVRGDEPGVRRGLHPLTEQSLAKYAPDAEMHYVGTRHDAYRELLEEVWRDGESFLVVEHDIELSEGLVEGFAACSEPWCAAKYVVGSDPNGFIETSLGCTRFSAELLAAVPNAISGLPVRDWRRIDCELSPRLRGAGYAPHVHSPPVRHHHTYPAPGGHRCACGEEDCDARI